MSKPAQPNAGPRQQAVNELLAEEGRLLRSRHLAQTQREDLDAQIAAYDRRLLLLRGKIEGVDLGRAFAQEMAEAALLAARQQGA